MSTSSPASPAVVKLALLGDDSRAASLLRSFVDPNAGPTRIALTAGVAASRTLENLRAAGIIVPNAETAISQVAPGAIDAVVVAADDHHLLELARRLAAAGKPLLVLPLTGQTTAFAYELTLLQTDAATTLIPLFAWRAHPQVQQVRELLVRGALGTIQHVELERRVQPGIPGGRIPSKQVADNFLEDVDLLRLLLGEIGNVTAVRAGDTTGGFWSQTVTLGAKAGIPATWSLIADSERSSWRLTLAATAGRVILDGVPGQHSLTLAVTGVACEQSPTSLSAEPGACWRHRFLEAMQPQHGHPSDHHSTATADWTDFTRAFEILEGIERSVRRRRTIDLEFEIPSERSQFKTHMTAVGCSLLMLTLVAIVAFLLGAQLLGLSPPTAKRPLEASANSQQQKVDGTHPEEQGPNLKRILAVVVIFLPLGLFLTLQIFYFIARPRAGPAEQTKVASRSDTASTE